MSFVRVPEAVNAAVGSDSTRRVGTLVDSLPSGSSGPPLLLLNPAISFTFHFREETEALPDAWMALTFHFEARARTPVCLDLSSFPPVPAEEFCLCSGSCHLLNLIMLLSIPSFSCSFNYLFK